MSDGMPDSLDVFHPLIRTWFQDQIGTPTEIQSLAWPRIARGEHVLVTAPTGSGKTLTAFLWALDRLLTGAWFPGKTRVLYVSPLKALNNDIRRNLERPLAELLERFRRAGEAPPAIRAVVRSGDTPPGERRKMLKQPPEILITTPESLNILLTSQSGRRILDSLETVILDEIHAVAASKRGTHLITAIDRLVPLSGEFQRVAISATVRPLEAIADWAGGFELDEATLEAGGEPVYRKRRVHPVQSRSAKAYDVKVMTPRERTEEEEAAPSAASRSDATWLRLSGDFKRLIHRNRSTLFFANSRRLTEKVTRLINEDEGRDLAYSHHGSLSREVRSVVEKRLKDGELPAIIATNSLELGIDIGSLDEVVLIQTPRSIASAVQRVGRAGHGVGEVSRARIYPTHGRDFLDAAVVARAIHEQDIEEVHPVERPLDVLAQVILSMTAAETWDVDLLFAQIRTSAPYHALSRRQFDLVLEMLAGRYADSRIRELKPRVSIDRVAKTVTARRGSARLVYMSGGTIADRGYFNLRLEESLAKIGELDEEFVWERSLGDTFTLGAQNWQIRRITHNDVLVMPARRSSAMAPFWRADALDRGFFLSTKVAAFLGGAEKRLEDPALAEELVQLYRLDPAAVAKLLDFLQRQKAATRFLPNPRRIVVERVAPQAEDRGGDGSERRRVIFHTFWGGCVHRPLGLALAAAWEERHGDSVEVVHDDDCLMLMIPYRRGDPEVDAAEILALVPPDGVEALLRRKLEQTGFFGARFRGAASTALLLPRSGFRHRTPLWVNRERSKKLLAAVERYGDFPVLVETWRTCLQDEFELDVLKKLLARVEAGEIEFHEARTENPSPFAGELGWQLTNRFMYEDDSPDAGVGEGSKLRPDLMQELVFSSELRPRLPAALVERFRRKAQRTAEGYAPRDGLELREWVGERVLIPLGEWDELLAATAEESGVAAAELVAEVSERVVRVRLPGAVEMGVASLERVAGTLERVFGAEEMVLEELESGGAISTVTFENLELLRTVEHEALPRDPHPPAPSPRGRGGEEILGEWLRSYGPLPPERLERLFGFDEVRLHEALEELREEQRIVVDHLVRRAPERREASLEICDAENLEILLRLMRAERRPGFTALEADALPLFLARHQGLVPRGSGMEDLQSSIEQLLGYPAPAAHWEQEILPARLDPYYPSWLDSLVQESDLLWLGRGTGRIAFAFPGDLELLDEATEETEEDARTEGIFPPGSGRSNLGELAARLGGRDTAELNEELWELAFAGRVTNDTFLAVRRGIESKWQDSSPPARRPVRRGSSRRRGGLRWQSARPYFGHWLKIERPAVDEEPDALEREELAKERARLLLDRYGIVFRQLLARESPALSWSRVFRSLRLMELSGEVMAGHFFKGIRGLQFMSRAAFNELRRGLPDDAIYWLNAADPASLCGIEVDGLKERLPARRDTTHLVFHGRRRVVLSQRRGRELEIAVEPDHPHAAEYFEFLKVLLSREFQPQKSIDVETINGEPAPASPWASVLGELFRAVREPRTLKLWKRY